MKWQSAILGASIYLLGLVVVQTHLLSYGISEISPLQIYYALVGSLLIVTLLPAILTMFIAELWLLSNLKRVQKVVTAGLILFVALMALSFILRFNSFKFVVNIRSYPYPRAYPINNIIVANAYLVTSYILLFLIRYLSGSTPILRAVQLIILVSILFWYAVFFGRTVYPAIDQGAWGAAPQFAELVSGGVATPCLVLHRSPTGIYFIVLKQIPDDLEGSDPFRQYTAIPDSPVRRAVFENHVSFIPIEKIDQLQIYGLNKADAYLK